MVFNKTKIGPLGWGKHLRNPLAISHTLWKTMIGAGMSHQRLVLGLSDPRIMLDVWKAGEHLGEGRGHSSKISFTVEHADTFIPCSLLTNKKNHLEMEFYGT